LENSSKQRIQRLKITSAGTGRVIVDFGIVKAPINSAPNTTPRKVISVIIVGENPKWNARTLAEVEEQIERTRQRNTAPILALVGLVVIMLVAFLLQVGVVKKPQDLSDVMWLDKESLDRVETLVSQNRPITEEEQREITTIQLRTLVKSQKAQEPPKGRGRKLLLMGLPTLALVICSAVLGFTCYPSAVFLWGDENDRYASLVNRRKILWGVIISLIVVGVLSKFLYEAIALWLPSTG
jgi:hypothetical protein